MIANPAAFRVVGARLAVAIAVAATAIGAVTARRRRRRQRRPLPCRAIRSTSCRSGSPARTGAPAACLDDRRGAPILVSMFYTSCQFVCPMLIETVRDIEAKLSAEEREHLTVLLVSIDPAHDSVEVLKRTADERHVDSARWTLARTDAATVRKLAAVLGIQYRALADGEINHTTAVILRRCRGGESAARTSRLGGADPAS